MKVACPFCKHNKDSLRGDCCCLCDYEGMIPEKENIRLLDRDAVNTDEYPFWSNIDLKAARDILSAREKENLEVEGKLFQGMAEILAAEETMPQDLWERNWTAIQERLTAAHG